MRCLYIDLASNKGLLALVTEKSVLAAEHIDHRMEDHALMPRLEKLLQPTTPRLRGPGVAGCTLQDLTQIACVVGPGGFMSLRVAAALANTLADQLQIPIAGIHLSEMYAERMRPTPPRLRGPGHSACGIRNYVWLHSTKKQELFVRGFGDWAKTWPVPMHVTLEKFIEILRRDALHVRLPWAGELIPEHRAALPVAAAIYESPLQRVEDILPPFLQKQEFKWQILEPWYGRGW